MIFLLEYNRPQGHLVTFRSFTESQRQEAENQRLEMELTLHRSGVEHEVVLLDAVTEEALIAVLTCVRPFSENQPSGPGVGGHGGPRYKKKEQVVAK